MKAKNIKNDLLVHYVLWTLLTNIFVCRCRWMNFSFSWFYFILFIGVFSSETLFVHSLFLCF